MKKFFAPEVVQTSALDCGPASLKCLLEGFGTNISYGRLREACQTGIDGTSIDTIEAVANQLGLEAEQIMLPLDHLLEPVSSNLPAVVVTTLPSGLTHFVVAWRWHGRVIQVMDPAVGRRWSSADQFASEVYLHTMQVDARDWREFAASDEFQCVLGERLRRIGASKRKIEDLKRWAFFDEGWNRLAALDAGTRVITSIARAKGIRRGGDSIRLLERLCATPELIPARYWSARAFDAEQVSMRGAVFVRIRRKVAKPSAGSLDAELAAAVQEKPLTPGLEIAKLLWQSRRLTAGVLCLALAAAAGGTLIEALLFRGLFDFAGELELAGQRLAGIAAILLFGLALLLIEVPALSAALRIGRQMEITLRAAFLAKIPKLGDRYFQSRLMSDMAERAHATQRLRQLPNLARQMVRLIFELCATAAAIVWLEHSAAPFVLLTVVAALLPAFAAQPLLAERDLRTRSHAAGLTRFYLDAMLGLVAIRAHGAARAVRREHEKLLGHWADAALRTQRTAVALEALQLTAMFGLIALLLLARPLQGTDIGRVLLVVYWALNLPALGQEIGRLARQYPYYRNLTLRLLDPLGAPEEPAEKKSINDRAESASPPSIEFRDLTVEVSGHKILENIHVHVDAGSQVAIVGPSGAGKSSFVGMLLGWLKPSKGEVLVDGVPIQCEELRTRTAWVDPAVQLWNRSLFANLAYGSEREPLAMARVIDAALLRNVLESFPEGMQTKLGEGGGLVSGGEGQRIRLGRAMLRQNVRLVIMDEPFRGLDREKRRELLRRAREFWRGCTILCITHDIEETRDFDRVLVIERGAIVEDGSPKELSSDGANRYAQLLAAESETRLGLWCANYWRRIRIHSGRIVEEIPKPLEESRQESEVA